VSGKHLQQAEVRSGVISGLIFFVVVALFIAVGIFGGFAVLGISDKAFPAVSGSRTVNGNDHLILAWTSNVALSVATGLVTAALYRYRDITPKREMALVLIAFVIVASTSGANFILGDELINWRAQIGINIVLAILSTSLLIILWKWRSERPTLIAIKLISIGLLATFGLFMPLIWTLIAILYRNNLHALGADSVQGVITLASAAVGLVASLLSLRRQLAENAKPLI
jgi:hypothetical protein